MPVGQLLQTKNWSQCQPFWSLITRWLLSRTCMRGNEPGDNTMFPCRWPLYRKEVFTDTKPWTVYILKIVYFQDIYCPRLCIMQSCSVVDVYKLVTLSCLFRSVPLWTEGAWQLAKDHREWSRACTFLQTWTVNCSATYGPLDLPLNVLYTHTYSYFPSYHVQIELAMPTTVSSVGTCTSSDQYI